MSNDDPTIEHLDRTGDILEPDALLASQFFDGLGGRPHAEGERRLMAAVLEDAIRCLERGAASDRIDQRAQCRDARKWVASSDESWFFSFENVCQTLGINPAALRRRLLDAARSRDGAAERAQTSAVASTACASAG